MTECSAIIRYPDWQATCELGEGHVGNHCALGKVNEHGYFVWSVTWTRLIPV